MQTLEWTTFDKSKWGDGPWQQEPDKKQWLDETTNLPCLIVRNQLGALCGYVGVSRNHPLHGIDYCDPLDSLRSKWEKIKEGDIGKRGVFTLFGAAFRDQEQPPTPEMIIDVHGSLTFAGSCKTGRPPEIGICHVTEEGDDDDVWWFGFDCGHCDDWSPKLYGVDVEDKVFQKYYGTTMIYRDLEYVTAEIKSLALQLKELEGLQNLQNS